MPVCGQAHFVTRQPWQMEKPMLMDVSQAMSVAAAERAGGVPIFSPLEKIAIVIGMEDGRSVGIRSRLQNFFLLFANRRPVSLANPRLEALRAYAELTHALFPRSVPTTSLEDAGFSALQTRALLDMIGRQAEPLAVGTGR
jgi:hypothetical protein